MAWLEGDLKIFAAGLAIGGEWNLGEVKASDVVTCWNDEGNYDYFYLKFKSGIKPFSYGQFVNTVKVYSITSDSYLPISTTSRIDQTTYKVFCDIRKETAGVAVIGLPTHYLSYLNGAAVPSFLTIFYIEGIDKITTAAYAWDVVAMSVRSLKVTDNAHLYTCDTLQHIHTEYIQVKPHTLNICEKVSISYYQGTEEEVTYD